MRQARCKSVTNGVWLRCPIYLWILVDKKEGNQSHELWWGGLLFKSCLWPSSDVTGQPSNRKSEEEDGSLWRSLSPIVCATDYVCLFNRSLRAETHLGPDGTRLEQNAQARLKSLSMLANWSMEIKRERNRFEDMGWRKRRPWSHPTNQVKQF